jgi:hypothetical protein
LNVDPSPSIQAIYQFMGSDGRYLTLAKDLFSHVNPLEWRELKLKTSYRSTVEMAEFINKAVVRSDRLKGKRRGGRPQYFRYNADFHEGDKISDHLLGLIKLYRPENTMVVAPSLGGRWTPVVKFENFLVNKRIRVYVSRINGPCPEVAAKKVTFHKAKARRGDEKKVTFTTFHKAKGRQGDLVILFGFEWWPNHHYPKDKCPNKLYVGLTRAKKQLVVLQKAENEPLPFLDHDALRETVSSNGCVLSPCDGNQMVLDDAAHPKDIPLGVIDLLAWLPFNEIEDAANKLAVECITQSIPDQENKMMKKIPAKCEDEEVSDLTSVAMHRHLALAHKGEIVPAYQLLKAVSAKDAFGSYIGRDRHLKRRQGFRWVPQDAFHLCEARFREIIGKEKPRLEFEYNIEVDIAHLTAGSKSTAKILSGRIDASKAQKWS